MGKPEVEAYLTWLACQRSVSASTHRQALSALLFLYKEVPDIELPWLDEIGRPRAPERLPTVLSRDEVERLFALIDGEVGLLARLLYGTGMRLMEGLRLRVKDVDFDRRSIIVREGKGGKDRVVMLPQSLREALHEQLARARALWAEDRAALVPGVEMPDALARKYPRAAETWTWHWVFPSPTLSTDPSSGIRRRHHLYEERLQRAIKKAVARADINKPVSVHTLRHSFALHLLQGAYDIRTVQELLGHADVKTTMIYTHVPKVGGGGVISPLDSAPGTPRAEQPAAHYAIVPPVKVIRNSYNYINKYNYLYEPRATGGPGFGAVVAQSARPSLCWTGIACRSMPSRQRMLMAAMALPFGSMPSPYGCMPHTGQKRCLITCLLKV